MQLLPTRPGYNSKKIPLSASHFKDRLCINAHLIEDNGQLIHECIIDIALAVFDDFCLLSDFDRPGKINTVSTTSSYTLVMQS